MIIEPALRTKFVREYYFSRKLKEIGSLNKALSDEGKPGIINLGIGAPDGIPPVEAIDTLCEEARNPRNHAYQSYIGIPELRKAFADWYSRCYGVSLNPADEIQPLFGSKEGILLTNLAFVNEGDKVLVPDPGYPTYTSASRLVGAEIVTYDLDAANGWQPDFEKLEQTDLGGVKIMWTNYPNMPTGAAATEQLFKRLVEFGRKHKILIVNDNPYSLILNDNPLSILATEGAKECCLELNSLSKAHNMSGWRIGMLAGASELISEVLKVKSQMDSGMFKPMQLAAVKALQQGPEWTESLNAEYRKRRVAAGRIFDMLGAEYDHNSAGLFLWGHVKEDNPLVKSAKENPHLQYANESGSIGETVSNVLLYGASVFITPGFIFGENGRDYIRISLCANTEILSEAERRIQNVIENR